MNHARCRTALFVLALVSSALLLACGGRSAGTLSETGDAQACAPSRCPSNLAWDPGTCTCDVSLVGDGGQPVETDATTGCAELLCPAGSVAAIEGGECVCNPLDSGVDATSIDDATPDSPYPDVSQGQYPDASYPDVSYYPPLDALEPFDAPFTPDVFCPPYFCGNGYAPNEFCECVPCTTTCPLGQSPNPGCNGCVACSYACPAAFDYGPGCSCVPHGIDAGNPPPPPVDGGHGVDGGGVTCLLEGYTQCSAGSWCELGICPDNKTQYGCYCSADGTATCDVSCPQPPPCTIPGQGTCPYGAECVYGSCAEPSASLLACSCNSGGTAYCYTSSCSDGGPFVPDSGSPGDAGGVTCLLEGYVSCNAGSFCSLGTCPDGTTQYGCFCNQDGTATCNLTCPPPPPCEIPGEGSCPYGSQCTFGTCNGNVGTQLACYCEYGGSASCYTVSCSASDGGLDN